MLVKLQTLSDKTFLVIHTFLPLPVCSTNSGITSGAWFLVFGVNLPLQNSRARILSLLKAGKFDFVAAACAETDRHACFICKASRQNAQSTGYSAQLLCWSKTVAGRGGPVLSELFFNSGCTRDQKDTWDGGMMTSVHVFLIMCSLHSLPEERETAQHNFTSFCMTS